MKTLIISLVTTLFFVASAMANDTLGVRNVGFEENAGSFEGPISWGPSGGVATHAGFSQPGYTPELGNNFMYMSSLTAETVGQVVSNITQAAPAIVEEGKIYTFSCWAIGGGGVAGKDVVLQIGYSTSSDSDVYSPSEFTVLASAVLELSGSWTNLYSVSYTVGSGPEVGNELAVRFGGVDEGATGNDAWIDNPEVSVIPEPSFLGIGALALLFFRRR